MGSQESGKGERKRVRRMWERISMGRSMIIIARFAGMVAIASLCLVVAVAGESEDGRRGTRRRPTRTGTGGEEREMGEGGS